MAEDLWERTMLVASFGGEELDLLGTDDTMGRVVVSHRYPFRDGADTEDLGGEQRVTSCRVIFIPRADDPTDDPYDRFLRLEALKASGEPHDFVHPLTGTYRARITDFRFSADAEQRDCIMVDVTFVEHSTEVAIFRAGAGAPLGAGLELVTATAADVDAAAAAAGVTTDAGSLAVAAATKWATLEQSGRDVTLELAAISNTIDREVERLELATNVRRQPLYRALTRLRYQLRLAARAVKTESPRIVEITVGVDAPLLVIVARTYPGDDAETRYKQLRELNDIRNPALVRAGTVLRAYAPGTSRLREAA